MIRDNLAKGAKTSDATALADDILTSKTAYIASGKVTGTMVDNGAVEATIDTLNTSYVVPQGYHNGQGRISVITQTKNVTPTTNNQTVTADNGKVLSSVSIEAIQTQSKSATPSGSVQTINPDNGYYLSSVSVGAVTNSSGIGLTLYNDGYSAGNTAGYNNGYSAGVSATKVGTAEAAQVLNGYTFTNASSIGTNGSMTNQGAFTTTVQQSASSNYDNNFITIPKGYHNGNGKVTIKGYLYSNN